MSRHTRCVMMAVCIVIAAGVSAADGQQPSYPPTASLDEIRRRVSECPLDHPRLFATRSEFAALVESLDRDPLRRQLADLIVRQAIALRGAEAVERKLTGRRLLGESRRCVQRVLTLAMAYHLTGDVQHAERCKKEMLAAARFSDWNPSHFLDVAEMTFALAIGYDWLYDQLDDGAQQEIRTAIIEKGVKLPFETRHNGWVRARNNWGQVCHGGLTAGALAVLEHEPELAARTVHNAMQNVVASMTAFGPRGSYPEGPGYWSYGTSYNVLLIDLLEGVFGSDFGLSGAPGFDETGGYPALVCGPSGLFFNYADGSPRRSPEPIRFWFASRYQRPDWLLGERELWQRVVSNRRQDSLAGTGRFLPLVLLWMGDQTQAAPAEIHLPLHWNSGGKVPVAVHRSSWSDPRATFVGLKAGSPSANHGQMDTGSFILESDGIRWAIDLGAEDYHRIESRRMNLWSSAQDSDRWTIFRQSNHGHNTLVIDDQLQVAVGDAPIVKFSDDPAWPHTIVNLTSVYEGQAESAERGVRLLPSREVLIQDELTGLRPGSRVRWGMITTAELDALGQSVLTLRQAGERLTLRLIAPNGTGWKQIDTARPRNEWDSPNPDSRMVAFEAVAPDSGKLKLVVTATPGSCTESVADELEIEPLERWDAPEAAATKTPYMPTAENLAAREWFQDARFGIFVHWGVYSLLERGEWAMNNEKMTNEAYEKIPPRFNPTKYDPAQWVELFKRSGAKYVTITAKHSDGFAMWDSKASDWDIVDRTPYGRDVLKPLASECRRQGLKLFFYYSQLDWHHSDYFPRGRTGHASGRANQGDWNEYLEYMDSQLAELLGGDYGQVAGIWLDGWWDQQTKYIGGQNSADPLATNVDWQLRRTYDLIHRLQPACLIGNNHHVAPFAGEDFQMFERDLPGENKGGHSPDAKIGNLPLETCDTINRSWGYNAADKNYKSVRQLVHYLVQAAGRNANFLLNVGPRPDGTIDPEMVSRLEGLGKWLSQFGHTIYETRGGPTGPQPWGTTTQTADTIYLHILDASPADPDGWITLTGTESLSADQLRRVVNGAVIPSRRDTQGRLQANVEMDESVHDLVLKVTRPDNL